jgi:hypothetical protein
MTLPYFGTRTAQGGFIKSLAATAMLAISGIASAADQASEIPISISGKSFGAGLTISVTNAKRYAWPSLSYTYDLKAKCKGDPGTALGTLVKPGTTLAAFLESISKGSSKKLKGTVSNPTGTLPFTLMNRTFKGKRTIAGIGVVNISLDVIARIDASGKCFLEVKNVKMKSTPKQKLGSIKFLPGSRLLITVPPVLAFQNATKSVSESATSVVVEVKRFRNFKNAISVNYATVDGSADSVNDYTATSGTLNFAAGEASKSITIPLIDNALADGLRTFTVQLSDPSSGSHVGTYPSIAVSIEDND